MFTRLGRFTVRRRKAILAGSVLVLALAGVLGGGVFSRLSGGGFDNPGSDSSRTEQALHDTFHTGIPNYILLVDATGGKPVSSTDPNAVPAVNEPAVNSTSSPPAGVSPRTEPTSGCFGAGICLPLSVKHRNALGPPSW